MAGAGDGAGAAAAVATFVAKGFATGLRAGGGGGAGAVRRGAKGFLVGTGRVSTAHYLTRLLGFIIDRDE